MTRHFRTAASAIALTMALGVATAAAAADGAGAAASSPSTVDEVIVTAQQQRKQVESNGQVGVLGAQDALSTPFNVTAFTSKLILDQQSETIGAVLLNDPSVRLTFGSGNQQELFVVRGLVINSDDVAYDGLYGILPRQLVSPELFDTIQVLNGASAFAYGAAPGGSLGGTIDLIPKRATRSLFRVTGNYIADSIWGGAADAAMRFGPNDMMGLRANTVYRTGDSAIKDEHREVRADSIDFDVSHGPARAFVDLGYEDQRAVRPRPEVRLGTGVAVPAPPKADYNFGQAWSFTSLRDVFGAVRGELDLTKNIEAYAALGFRHGREVGDYSTLTVTNATTGAATGSRLFVPRKDRNSSGLIGLRAKFNTGPLTHQVNVGASSITEENFNSFTFGSFPPGIAASSTAFFDNLYNTPQVARPTNSTLPSSGGSLTNLPLLTKTIFQSAFASDTIGAFDDRLLLTLGERDQKIDVKGYNRGTLAQTSNYDLSKVTPVVGLVVKPTEFFSVYGNRTEALVQGPTAPTSATTINPGQVFPPFVVVQYEAGAKLQYHAMTATIAYFTLKQPSAFAVPVAGSTTLTQFGIFGEQRNRGLEITMNGEPTDYLRLIGGVTFNDVKLEKTAGGTNNGHKAIGVPDYQANIGVEFIPPMMRQLVLTGRWLLTGKQFVDPANTQQVGSWNRLDLGARYVAVIQGHPTTFRVTVENVTDKAYWESAFGGYLVLAEPRTAKASITFEY